MTEQNDKDNKDLRPPSTEKPAPEELDAAGKSLSEALRISFIILKVIMIVLVVAFLASGFETVDPDEQALVLRFGKIQGVGEKRLLGPGPHWIFPYPIDEIVKIPVKTQVNLAIDSFWYFQTKQEIISGVNRKVAPDKPLNPVNDGYCLTRSEKASEAFLAAQKQDGSDYNIVHTKWQLTYQIDNPERFFRNIYVEDIKPGDIYFDVITKNITPLLENLFEDTIVTEMVNYTIDEAISSRPAIRKRIERLLQDKLDKIESGIKVVSVQLTKSECPRQIADAFEASTKASQTSQKSITEAKSFAENTINEAAGPVAFDLLKDKKSVAELSEQEQQLLWSQLAGKAREQIAEARAYRTSVVETAKANADYLESLLPEYRQRPKLVIQKIYLDAIEQIMNNADEKLFIQTAEGIKGKEVRVNLNRDPSLKPKTSKEQTTQGD
ncbi:MAG: protease modulator HflK [Planctomycetota bacterium]|jgi:membrane protease subunit HflK